MNKFLYIKKNKPSNNNYDETFNKILDYFEAGFKEMVVSGDVKNYTDEELRNIRIDRITTPEATIYRIMKKELFEDYKQGKLDSVLDIL